MITEQYVSFETARLLKEAGFREKTKTHYSNRGEVWETAMPADYNDDFNCNTCNRPTQQLAARWLREVHGIIVDVTFCPPKQEKNYKFFIGEIEDMVWEGDYDSSNERYATYEEAMEGALRQALIRIIKNKEQ